MRSDNDALWIALQSGTSGIAWGTTGVAKTAFFEALAKKIGYECHVIIPSQMLPEDIGGFPDIDKKTGRAKMVYLDIIHDMTKPKRMMVIDEITTAPQAMKPPLLSAINEKRVAKLLFHPTSIVGAIANPPEIAPNGSELEPSLCNRLYHHKWTTPYSSYLSGMINGGKFEVPDSLPVVGDISCYLPKWCGIIGRMLERHPEIRETNVIPEGVMSFPSPRSWYNLARCLAGADKVGANSTVRDELACGLVGEDAGGVLAEWLAARSLYDAAAVVDRIAKVDYSDARVDQLIYLPVGILETLDDDHSDARISNALEVLIDMGEHGMLDRVMPVLSEIKGKASADGAWGINYKVPRTIGDRYGKLVSETLA